MPGGTYIFDEATPQMSVAVFEGIMRTGRPGLLITGEPVELARRRLSMADKTEFAWVTDVSAPGAIKPAMIDQINARRERFVEKHPHTIMLFDIMSTLLSANEFANVFKFYSYIRDDTQHRDTMTLISLDSNTMDGSQYRKLHRLGREVFSDENPPDAFLPALQMEEGRTYLLKSGGKRGYRIAAAAGRTDRPVLCLVRTFPDSIREQAIMPEWTEFHWLSKAEHPGVLRPDRPQELFKRLSDFMMMGRAVVLLDGIDLLIAEIGFNELFKMTANLKDLARMHKGNLLLLIPPGSLTPGEYRKLVHEVEVIEGAPA